MMMTIQTAADTLAVHCPGCGRRMLLPLSPGIDGEDALRLARAVRCDRCSVRKPARPKVETWLPYRDD
jgi:DNA-directed RNA polymerase subunit RPC12/RpoP